MSEEKYYQLGTHTAEQFVEVHDLLCAKTSEDYIPDRECTCYDDKLHSPTRGTFLLTDTEANLLKSDSRIKFINIDYSMYDEYKPPQDELQSIRPTLVQRYTGTIKNYREFETSNTLPVNTDSTDANRSGYQLYRHQQFLDPWVDNSLADNAVPEATISQYGSGKNIDVIVADEGCWIGHPEFQNNVRLEQDGSAIESPADYVGGNLLPGNGTCDILDVYLDGPYYIDPDWFNEDPGTRLTTRFDGTIVPTEAEARQWWLNPGNRSPQFIPIGSISVSPLYTRNNTQGDNTLQPNPNSEGQHGTPCCALTYGRTQGWAYNANKWMLDLYGSYGAGIETGFDIQKAFHLYKPINPQFGNRNPTISSNSWGYRSSKGDNPGWYHFRNDLAVTYNGIENEPNFISNMGVTGDGGRWKSEMKTNSLTTALDELIDSGVLFVVASGNSNQKQVNWGHPDFDNYISANSDDTLEESNYSEFGVAVTGTTNRRGFPQQGGKAIDGGTGEVTYKTINIGALDDDYAVGNLERKVNYSDRGNGIDVYAAADGTLAANKNYLNEGIRADTYDTLEIPAYDCAFSGTSAACPVVAGFLATILEHNRDWTYQEVQNWIASLDVQDPTDFYYGVESTTANDANWLDYNSLEGGPARVLYPGPFDARFIPGPRQAVTASIALTNGLTLRFNK